jgi:hypothetical protein
MKRKRGRPKTGVKQTDRIVILAPRALKNALIAYAKKNDLSEGEAVRRAIEKILKKG